MAAAAVAEEEECLTHACNTQISLVASRLQKVVRGRQTDCPLITAHAAKIISALAGKARAEILYRPGRNDRIFLLKFQERLLEDTIGYVRDGCCEQQRNEKDDYIQGFQICRMKIHLI